MNDRSYDKDPRCHFLFPFEAQPSALAGLRRAVRRQLGLWGALPISDVAELAVTELATNVIRHVGQGAPATLVMEARDGRVRVELHDTNSTLPRCVQPGPDVETGRGLSLVAAVSAGWFAMSTTSGKAVCCDFASPGPLPPGLPDPRITRGSEAVQLYALQWGGRDSRPIRSLPAIEATAVDLITDVLHWLAANGRDPDTTLDHAQMRFEAGSEGVGA